MKIRNFTTRMAVNKKDYTKIEEGFKDIFKTEVQKGGQNNQYGGVDGLMTIVKEPLVKHQIIKLAKLCEEVSANVTLKSLNGGIFIEFWQMP
tara:strand:+ start:9684 stop:9959 length:276 start_codon:yes stop_codon:yes gene_type:complete